MYAFVSACHGPPFIGYSTPDSLTPDNSHTGLPALCVAGDVLTTRPTSLHTPTTRHRESNDFRKEGSRKKCDDAR
jgi:hypothetical protein